MVLAGAVQCTVAAVFPGVALTPPGADGANAGGGGPAGPSRAVTPLFVPIRRRPSAADGEAKCGTLPVTFRNADPSGFAFNGWRHINTSGLVGQYELLLGDNAAFGAAVRHDFNSRFADDTTYRVQGSYRFASGTRIRAAAGSGVKYPGIFELFHSTGNVIGVAPRMLKS